MDCLNRNCNSHRDSKCTDEVTKAQGDCSFLIPLRTQKDAVVDAPCNVGLCADSSEEQFIEFEATKNEAIDKYFDARPGLARTRIQEDIFEGGFRMAWEKR